LNIGDGFAADDGAAFPRLLVRGFAGARVAECGLRFSVSQFEIPFETLSDIPCEIFG
jgi:hypothetical protein